MRRSRAQPVTSRLEPGGTLTQIRAASFVFLLAGLITLGAGLQMTTGVLSSDDGHPPEQRGMQESGVTAASAEAFRNNDGALPPAAPLQVAAARQPSDLVAVEAAQSQANANPPQPQKKSASSGATVPEPASSGPEPTNSSAALAPVPSATLVAITTATPESVATSTATPPPTSTPLATPTLTPPTPVPPTATSMPPTATPVPPTAVPPTSTATPSTASAPPPQSISLSSLEDELFRSHNVERASLGLGSLELDAVLVQVARERAQDMADKNYFAHTSPTGETAFSIMNEFGYFYLIAGENIARNNYPDVESASVAMNGFMNSSAHRDNILDARFNKVGVGLVIDGSGMKYFAVVFAGN